MRGTKRRLKDLEKKVLPPEKHVTVVDWDPEPGPEEPGVKYVYWDDIDDEGENDED